MTRALALRIGPLGAAAIRRSDTRNLLTNASSLLGTTAVTSLLGLVFWGAAARFFSVDSVGEGSAAVSAMTLLGTFGMFGVGTVLIGRLGQTRANAVSTILAALLLVAAGSAVLGLLGALALPLSSPSLRSYAHGALGICLFTAGVVSTAVGFVLDQALIGMLRGGLQLARNFIFSAAKLCLLIIAGLLIHDPHGIALYVTWTAGNVISFVGLAAYLAARGVKVWRRPDWTTMHRLRGVVLVHNWLNGAMQAPRLLLPVLVVALMSPAANAAFYAAYLIASFLYMVPTHLSTVLFAIGAADQERLRDQTRFSLLASTAVGILGCVLIAASAPLVLRLFGASYAARGSAALRILALGVFPTMIKVHFVAVCRATGRITRGGIVMTFGGALELAAAAFGLHIGGLTGLSIALDAAMCVVAAFAMADLRMVISLVPRRPPMNAVDTLTISTPPRQLAKPAISVIICAYSEKRWEALIEAVASLKEQSRAPLEILLVIDHNERLLMRARRDLRGVTVLANANDRGAGGARNTGVAAARGTVVAFLDDDATAHPEWIARISAHMRSAALLGVGGGAQPRWMSTPPKWFPDEFGWVIGCSYRGMPVSPQPIRNLMAGNMAMHRDVFITLGGYRQGHGNVQDDVAARRCGRQRFVTRQSGCEETDLCIRGLIAHQERSWLFDPAICIDHRVPVERTRLRYFLSRCNDEGIAKATVVVKHSGAELGLQTERDYVRRTLPRGVVRGVIDCARGDLWGAARAAMIVIGLATTSLGFMQGQVQAHTSRIRRRPAIGTAKS